MLTVTPSAGVRLQQFLESASAGDVVRIVRNSRRLKLRKSRPRPGDTLFHHDGQLVLVLTEKASETLASRTLDTRETDDGPKLQLKPR